MCTNALRATEHRFSRYYTREFASGNKTAQAKASARNATYAAWHQRTASGIQVRFPTHQSQYTCVAVWNCDKREVSYCDVPGHNCPATILASSRPPLISTVSQNWQRSQRAACCGSCQNIFMKTTTHSGTGLPRKARGKPASCACAVTSFLPPLRPRQGRANERS